MHLWVEVDGKEVNILWCLDYYIYIHHQNFFVLKLTTFKEIVCKSNHYLSDFMFKKWNNLIITIWRTKWLIITEVYLKYNRDVWFYSGLSGKKKWK